MDQNKIAELERLGELLRAGAITQDEFERLKKATLDGLAGQPPKAARPSEAPKPSSADTSAAKNSSAASPPEGRAALSTNVKGGIAVGVTLFLMMSAGITSEIIDSRNMAATRRLTEAIAAEERAAGRIVLYDGQKIGYKDGQEIVLELDQFVMPDVICMNLQDAQDLMQEITGDWLRLSDSYEVGGNSPQIRDRNWLVLRQSPAAGEILEFDDVPNFGVDRVGKRGSGC
jgi:hypothetical protein